MKIKIAILDSNENFASRIASVLSTNYAHEFEVYSFTNLDEAKACLNRNRINILVASEVFDILPEELPGRCALVFFTDSNTVETINGCTALFRYQQIDAMYRQLLNVYSRIPGNETIEKPTGNCKVVVFSSPCGGTGTSCMAAACARYFSRQGKKTLYLNLERYGISDVFFNAAGSWTMSDVISTLKLGEPNFIMKALSFVRQDQNTGVYFFSGTQFALHMVELSLDEIQTMIEGIEQRTDFDYVIADMDFSLERGALDIYRQAHRIVWVSDGSDVANSKIVRAYQAVDQLERDVNVPFVSRMCLAYNKFSNRTGHLIDGTELRDIGGMHKVEHATTEQILDALVSKEEIFEKILQIV